MQVFVVLELAVVAVEIGFLPAFLPSRCSLGYGQDDIQSARNFAHCTVQFALEEIRCGVHIDTTRCGVSRGEVGIGFSEHFRAELLHLGGGIFQL